MKRTHFGPWSAVAAWKVEFRYNVGIAQAVDTAAMIHAAEELLAAL